jgi:hypothetical protein
VSDSSKVPSRIKAHTVEKKKKKYEKEVTRASPRYQSGASAYRSASLKKTFGRWQLQACQNVAG